MQECPWCEFDCFRNLDLARHIVRRHVGCGPKDRELLVLDDPMASFKLYRVRCWCGRTFQSETAWVEHVWSAGPLPHLLAVVMADAGTVIDWQKQTFNGVPKDRFP